MLRCSFRKKSWNTMKDAYLDWASLGFVGFHWVSLDLIGPHRTSSHLISVLWALSIENEQTNKLYRIAVCRYTVHRVLCCKKRFVATDAVNYFTLKPIYASEPWEFETKRHSSAYELAPLPILYFILRPFMCISCIAVGKNTTCSLTILTRRL